MISLTTRRKRDTIVRVAAEEGTITARLGVSGEGVARCRSDDVYSLSTGELIALGRAIQDFGRQVEDAGHARVVSKIELVELKKAMKDEEKARASRFEFYEDNPLRQRSETGGVKDNIGKPAVELIPTKPLLAVGRVLGFGARKYKPHNWRLGLSWSQTLGSALRHLLAFADGEDIDPESGEPHVACALTQVTFLTEYYLTRTGTDDRWASSPESKREEARA